MAYSAIVSKIRNIRNHPNADRLNLGVVQGYQIIIGKDQTEDELGIFFPEGGQLSHQYCMEKNLYKKDPETGKPMGGMFDSNRRVKSIKLRGEYSEGFWTPLGILEKNFKEGDLLTSLNGKEICKKYITPATMKANSQKQGNKNKNKKKAIIPTFHEHFSTKQLRMNLHKIPVDADIYVTAKLHGTSGRTGNHLIEFQNENWFQKFRRKFKEPKWDYISGSRKVQLNFKTYDGGYYKDTSFRKDIHNKIKEIGLYKNETLYYEIVGYQDNGSLIMGTYNTEDKEIIKKYGKDITFSYGCRIKYLERDMFDTQYKIYIYRISMVNPDGKEIDYSWEQTKKRCNELGLLYVPEIKKIKFKDINSLLKECKELTSGPDTIDSSHPIEGIVLRVEDKDCFDFFKYKGSEFCLLENIRNNDEAFIDMEESN